MSERAWKILSLLLLVWAVVSTSLYVNSLTPRSQGREQLVTVNIGIKYKNGSVEWYNATRVPSGSTLLNVTTKIADVNYTVWGIGAFVNSINGVKNEKPYYWMWWRWDPSMGWTLGPVAADKYVMSDGEIVMWYYEDTSSYPPEKP